MLIRIFFHIFLVLDPTSKICFLKYYRTHTFLENMGFPEPLKITPGSISNLRICHLHFTTEMLELQMRNVTLKKTAIPVHFKVGLMYPKNPVSVTSLRIKMFC